MVVVSGPVDRTAAEPPSVSLPQYGVTTKKEVINRSTGIITPLLESSPGRPSRNLALGADESTQGHQRVHLIQILYTSFIRQDVILLWDKGIITKTI